MAESAKQCRPVGAAVVIVLVVVVFFTRYRALEPLSFPLSVFALLGKAD